jgi:hypothetical protein
VVINDFHIVCTYIRPTKADTPLIVDTNAVLSRTITLEGFKVIAGWHPQIIKSTSDIKLSKLTACGQGVKSALDSYFDFLMVKPRLCRGTPRVRHFRDAWVVARGQGHCPQKASAGGALFREAHDRFPQDETGRWGDRRPPLRGAENATGIRDRLARLVLGLEGAHGFCGQRP